MVTSSYLAGRLIEVIELLVKALHEDHLRWTHIGKAAKILSELQKQHTEGHINEVGDIVKGGTDDGGGDVVKGGEIVKGSGDDGGQNPIHPGH